MVRRVAAQRPVAGVFQHSKRRMFAGVALCGLIALVAAGVNVGAISLFPPKLSTSNLQVSTAVSHVMVDSPGTSIVKRKVLPQDMDTLVRHAELMGRVMISPPVTDRIARRAGVPPDEFAGVGRTTAFVPIALTEPGSEQRASEIAWSKRPYRLEVQARPTSPILDVYTQAPSVEQAQRLADEAAAGLRDYLRSVGDDQGVPEADLVALRQLGKARAGIANGGSAVVIGGLTFMVAFVLSGAGLLGLVALRRRFGAPKSDTRPHATSPRFHALRERLASHWPESDDDDWPRTTRLLPWMLAVFLAMLWLVPFYSIELNASLPIDMRLDRLLLPFLVGTWLLALVAGGRVAPRLNWTWIHAAIAFFLACAFLSVVLDARYLNHTLEFDLSLKKLPLIVSYVSLFVITASVVRRSEVSAFLVYSLILASVLALGMVWEYRFKQNLFYTWSDRLLPGAFTVTQDAADAVDSMGRRLVRGSAGVPLEAVTMLSLALPIALVGLLRSTRRSQLLYGLAACLLVAAMFATYRKSALLAPVAVVLTIAYFRRRDLLKLAPLGLVIIVIVSALSPGALSAIVGQFTRADRAEVATVSDRASDYDAVRPDVWSHMIFGRGWGSYNHVDYRILDSEILHRTVEMGVLGLVSYLLIAVSVIAVARRPIASGDPAVAPAALIGAAGATAFLVAGMLYDVMSFPHGAYIFLYIAGLVTVLVRPGSEPEGQVNPKTAAALADHARRSRRRPPARRRERVPHAPPGAPAE